MELEKINTLIIGGGQAGLAMSEHLGNNQIDHLIIEKDRIVESWRTSRWDGLVANGPAWHDRFPTLKFSDLLPDEFATKDRVVAYFEEFAKKINAPIRCNVNVNEVLKVPNREKFKVKPTHTLMNLEYIKSQFPNHVLFFLLFKENIPIAGLCSFQVTKKVLNVFYLCHEQSSEANKPCDYLMVKFIDWAINNEFELIDLGPNNLNYEINYGLLKFKMGFNGITKIRKRYQLLIS